VDPDIFDGIARFHQNKCYFVDHDKGFFRKITRGPLLPIQVLHGEAYNFAAVKKNLSRFYGRKAKISRFKFALKLASGVPRCHGH